MRVPTRTARPPEPRTEQAFEPRGLSSTSARAVVTGNVGPNAFEALRAAGIDVYLTYAGTVERVVERLESGGLRPALRPSRRGHAKAGGAGSQAGY